jgi:isoleucyl-tRNA synthetase
MKKENPMPDFIKHEEEMLNFWQDNKIFDKLVSKNQNSNKRFRFLDGPITANNIMGVHHAWNRGLKDFMHRYKAMTGHSAQYQNGFDAQGLWVEVEVEKELGLKNKNDIEKYGLAKFTQACIARVDKYSKKIIEQSKRLGQWMDWDNSYFTNSDENITSIWYFLKECDKRGWLVQKYRPMPWCPHCGTSLSEHEIADSYLNMKHEAVFVKMPIKNTNSSILVWTTTPWTLPANVAVAVNPEFDYSECKVKSSNQTIILASNLLKVLKGDLVEVVKTYKGSELVGKEYETLFPTLPQQDFTHKIVAWDMVSAEDGTGAVHIAPGCGAEDFELGDKLGLQAIIPVDDTGKFYDDFGIFAGKKTNEIDSLVFEELKKANKLYYTHMHDHRYPICWRCKTPLIYRLTKEWYIKADEIRPLMIKACDTVKWQPEFMKKRMVDWLTNMGDWNISRKRYYGLPLPIYICDSCGHRTVIGSLDELKKVSSKEEVDALPKLHRPYIDDLHINVMQKLHVFQKLATVGLMLVLHHFQQKNISQTKITLTQTSHQKLLLK